MDFTLLFFLNSICLGVGLAMDAFSISLANGLSEHEMPFLKMLGVAGIFAFFQALMPTLGWFCVHTVASFFATFQKFVPFIALVLLGYIGITMLISGAKHNDLEVEKRKKVTFLALVLQGIATSIDALSVGFTTASYNLTQALISAFIIGAVTFVICLVGILIGKRFGTHFSSFADILGGSILVFIGLEIFISSLLGA